MVDGSGTVPTTVTPNNAGPAMEAVAGATTKRSCDVPKKQPPPDPSKHHPFSNRGSWYTVNRVRMMELSSVDVADHIVSSNTAIVGSPAEVRRSVFVPSSKLKIEARDLAPGGHDRNDRADC